MRDDTFKWVAPMGTADLPVTFEGRVEKKAVEYNVTAAIPHIGDTTALRVIIELLRMQTERPYIMVVDTGSPPEICAELNSMRAQDLEFHFIAGHSYMHSSEPVPCALDVAHALCRTHLLYHTHSDCFPRRRDFLESWARICNINTPVIGYRMSPRDWVTKDWEWMAGHTALMLYMPTIHRIGATWSFQRMHHAYGYARRSVLAWPDTETGFNNCLRDAGIVPVFLGYDRNGERQIDDNIDHVRSFTCGNLYSAEHRKITEPWMREAIRDAKQRLEVWQKRPAEPSALPTVEVEPPGSMSIGAYLG